MVASWATSAAEARAWCSFDGHPVPAQIVAGWGAEPGCRAFVLESGAEPVGYGELWVADDGSEVELGHLIVAPGARRQGYGTRLTEALVVRALDVSPNVFLRVRPDNHQARATYRQAGLQRVAAELEAEWNIGQPVDYVWMQANGPGR